MAVPALPADDSDSNDWNASKVNAIYDHIQWWRDTRPLFKGLACTTGIAALVTSGNLHEIGFNKSASTFENTPITNVGGFTVAGIANGDGDFNIEVPEAGHYEGFWNCNFEAHATGYRSLGPLLNSASIAGSSVKQMALDTGVHQMTAPFAVDCALGDELSVNVYQNSTTTKTATVYLFVKWVQST